MIWAWRSEQGAHITRGTAADASGPSPVSQAIEAHRTQPVSNPITVVKTHALSLRPAAPRQHARMPSRDSGISSNPVFVIGLPVLYILAACLSLLQVQALLTLLVRAISFAKTISFLATVVPGEPLCVCERPWTSIRVAQVDASNMSNSHAHGQAS